MDSFLSKQSPPQLASVPRHLKGFGAGGKTGAALPWTLCSEAKRTGRPCGDCPVLV